MLVALARLTPYGVSLLLFPLMCHGEPRRCYTFDSGCKTPGRCLESVRGFHSSVSDHDRVILIKEPDRRRKGSNMKIKTRIIGMGLSA